MPKRKRSHDRNHDDESEGFAKDFDENMDDEIEDEIEDEDYESDDEDEDLDDDADDLDDEIDEDEDEAIEAESKTVTPDDAVEFHDGKLWFRVEGPYVVVGITHAALDELGEVKDLELPSEGDDFTKDDILCEISGSDGSIKVYSPASGFVADLNSTLSDNPSLIEEDPFDEGWLVKLEIEDSTELKEHY